MNTDDPVTRSFSLHQKILLQINSLSDGYYGHLAEYISGLSWYHNGTEILSNERMKVSNGTVLAISKMEGNDAGKYEVKISSTDGRSSSCDRNILTMLEQTALHAPVTFYLQQYHNPQYKPEDIIEELYFLPNNSLSNSSHTITINYSTNVNTNVFLFGIYRRQLRQWFFKNGVSQSSNTDNIITEQSYEDEINISHQLKYIDIDEIVGHYVYMETIKSDFINEDNCHGYRNLGLKFRPTIVLVHYWSLKISKTKYG